jgi:hypothetical protein
MQGGDYQADMHPIGSYDPVQAHLLHRDAYPYDNTGNEHPSTREMSYGHPSASRSKGPSGPSSDRHKSCQSEPGDGDSDDSADEEDSGDEEDEGNGPIHEVTEKQFR